MTAATGSVGWLSVKVASLKTSMSEADDPIGFHSCLSEAGAVMPVDRRAEDSAAMLR
jgi:hypothetical protein